MTCGKHPYNHALVALASIACLIPSTGYSAVASEEYLGYLGTDTVIITILLANCFLLVAFLFHLRALRKNLSRKTGALEQTVERTRQMGDNLPNATLFQLEHDAEHGFSFRFISRGYEAVTGMNREHVMQHAALAFEQLYEEDIPLLREAYERSREVHDSLDLIIRVRDLEGVLKWLHIRAVPYFEDAILVWDGIVEDITQEKEIEAALLEEKRNFQNLFNTIDDLILIFDLDGKLLTVNPASESSLGYSADNLRDMNLCDLYPESAHSEVRQIITLMHSEESVIFELPFQKADGDPLPVELNLARCSWEKQPAIVAIARNTVHRQETEIALRESKKMLQLIIDCIPLSVSWKNKNSEYLGCNRSFIQECGLTDIGEILGKIPDNLFERDTAKSIMQLDQSVISTNQAIMNTLHLYHRSDGTTGQRESSKIPLLGEKGEAVGVLEIWRDVTEQNLAEDRLKRTLEDMERFNHLMRGRERRTLELKGEINQLLEELGRKRRYQTTAADLEK